MNSPAQNKSAPSQTVGRGAFPYMMNRKNSGGENIFLKKSCGIKNNV